MTKLSSSYQEFFLKVKENDYGIGKGPAEDARMEPVLTLPGAHGILLQKELLKEGSLNGTCLHYL